MPLKNTVPALDEGVKRVYECGESDPTGHRLVCRVYLFYFGCYYVVSELKAFLQTLILSPTDLVQHIKVSVEGLVGQLS